MTIRGGGDPARNMALAPRFRVGPPPRSPAADAHGCIMVRPRRGPTGYKISGARGAHLRAMKMGLRLATGDGLTDPARRRWCQGQASTR
jgi:hypothetical protein